MRTNLALMMSLAVGILMGVLGSQALSAQQMAEKRTPVAKTDMVIAKGMEESVTLVEMMPGAVGEKHFHNGDVMLYILEGSQTLEMDGRPPVTLTQGQAYHIDPKVPLTGKNPSATAPVRFLAFAVVQKGQPVGVPVK